MSWRFEPRPRGDSGGDGVWKATDRERRRLAIPSANGRTSRVEQETEMDATEMFSIRRRQMHSHVERLREGLHPEQIRARVHPMINPLAWLL